MAQRKRRAFTQEFKAVGARHRVTLAHRRPPRGVLRHLDRGGQCASGAYHRRLAHAGIVCSMSRRGDWWANAVAESFFATLKVELVHATTRATRAADARRAVRRSGGLLERAAATFSARRFQSPDVRATPRTRSGGNLPAMSTTSRQLHLPLTNPSATSNGPTFRHDLPAMRRVTTAIEHACS
jgi:transposase InsO family protein